jgi:hypothetical protein
MRFRKNVNFVSQRKSGKVVQIASLALDVTANRKLENFFQKPESKRLALELHASISEYHAALATNLDRFSRYESQPEKIPELVAQSADFVEASMRKLLAATARCFPKDQHH